MTGTIKSAPRKKNGKEMRTTEIIEEKKRQNLPYKKRIRRGRTERKKNTIKRGAPKANRSEAIIPIIKETATGRSGRIPLSDFERLEWPE